MQWRIVLTGWLLTAAPAYAVVPTTVPGPEVRDLGRRTAAPLKFASPALSRQALLSEIGTGERKLFGHDPHAPSADAPTNQFLLVRDRSAWPSHEHALGILTPSDAPQPAHIREVRPKDAPSLGRMIRALLFADRASEFAPPGGFANWDLYVNLQPSVPRLHVHAQPAGENLHPVSDWNVFASDRGYKLTKKSASHSVWVWPGADRAPNGWNVLAVANAEFGAPAELAQLSAGRVKKVDRMLGNLWLDAAQYARGYQVETSRTDSQIVARGVEW